jgi:hypothetical protein
LKAAELKAVAKLPRLPGRLKAKAEADKATEAKAAEN